MPDGILVLDKPAGISSAYAVTRIKRLLPRGTKVGHAGTLDPFATGVLLVLIGKATKRCESLMGQPKRYLATIKLGATTETLDPTVPEVVQPNPPMPTLTDVIAALPQFVGLIQQVPPAYSALWQNGIRAYDLARAGKPVELEPRAVQVYAIDLVRYEYPLLEIDVRCGRGTYIRSLARDVAAALNTTGYLTSLRRTGVGEYTAEKAADFASLTAESVLAAILP